MIDNWDFNKGLSICFYQNGFLYIGYTWIFSELEKIGFYADIYDCSDNCLYLIGNYQKNRIMEIKKFFFHNYPAISKIIPTRQGVKIYFKIRIKLNHPLSISQLLLPIQCS